MYDRVIEVVSEPAMLHDVSIVELINEGKIEVMGTYRCPTHSDTTSLSGMDWVFGVLVRHQTVY